MSFRSNPTNLRRSLSSSRVLANYDYDSGSAATQSPTSESTSNKNRSSEQTEPVVTRGDRIGAAIFGAFAVLVCLYFCLLNIRVRRRRRPEPRRKKHRRSRSSKHHHYHTDDDTTTRGDDTTEGGSTVGSSDDDHNNDNDNDDCDDTLSARSGRTGLESTFTGWTGFDTTWTGADTTTTGWNTTTTDGSTTNMTMTTQTEDYSAFGDDDDRNDDDSTTAQAPPPASDSAQNRPRTQHHAVDTASNKSADAGDFTDKDNESEYPFDYQTMEASGAAAPPPASAVHDIDKDNESESEFPFDYRAISATIAGPPPAPAAVATARNAAPTAVHKKTSETTITKSSNKKKSKKDTKKIKSNIPFGLKRIVCRKRKNSSEESCYQSIDDEMELGGSFRHAQAQQDGLATQLEGDVFEGIGEATKHSPIIRFSMASF